MRPARSTLSDGVTVSNVPLVDLGWQQREIADEVATGFARVLDDTSFIGGRDVAEFETAFAEFVGVDHCVGVANGTDALEIALRGLGVGIGDEVVVPANTFVATAEAVARVGASLVLVDVDDDRLLMSPDAVEKAVTDRTRAVIPVHLYGQCAPVDEIQARLEGLGIPIVEDAAQSQGSTHHGKPAGSLADVAATSFYPGKNLGAYGDAGAVLTRDADLARTMRLLSQHGSEVRYEHEIVGFNSRLDTLQAVVLRAKLARLSGWNQLRRDAADRYAQLLADVPDVRVPVTADGNVHVWHLYVVRVPRRHEVLAGLQQRGVGAAIHYPHPVHLHPAFAYLGHGPGAFPVAEAAADEILSLPLFPGISEDQQVRVVQALAETLGELGGAER